MQGDADQQIDATAGFIMRLKVGRLGEERSCGGGG